jgi:hypothetical protein
MRKRGLKKSSFFQKIFQKGIDKIAKVWYNIYRERERANEPPSKRKRD